MRAFYFRCVSMSVSIPLIIEYCKSTKLANSVGYIHTSDRFEA